MAEPLPCRSLPIPYPPRSLRQERERKEKEAALRCWEGLAELPLCGGDLLGQQDGAQPLPQFRNQSKTKQPGELAQLPVPRGRDAAGREAVLWDDSCQHLWWVTALPRHGDSKGHPAPGHSEERGRQPATTLALCSSSPPCSPRGTPRPPSDALPTRLCGAWARGALPRRVFVFFSAPVIKRLFFVSPPPLSLPLSILG